MSFTNCRRYNEKTYKEDGVTNCLVSMVIFIRPYQVKRKKESFW